MTPPPLSIDVAKYATLLHILADLEDEHEKAGWDNTPPTFYRIDVDRDEGTYHCLEKQFGNAQQFDALADQVVANPETMEARDDVTPGPPTLLVIIFEGWMNATDAAWRWMDGGQGRTLVGFPGTEEARFVIAMSDENRLVGFFRKKGDDFLTHHIFKQGDMFSNLIRMHRAINAYWRQKKDG